MWCVIFWGLFRRGVAGTSDDKGARILARHQGHWVHTAGGGGAATNAFKKSEARILFWIAAPKKVCQKNLKTKPEV